MGGQPLNIPDILLFSNKVYKDERGFFEETLVVNCNDDFIFLQENHSHSYKNIIRGLHYEINPHVSKLVRCINGEIFDVAVDIRPNSSTFKQYVSFYLKGSSGQSLFIPAGFAHGFCVVSKTADVVYKVSNIYLHERQRAIRWDDPDINITWPLHKEDAILSDKDISAPLLKDAEL